MDKTLAILKSDGSEAASIEIDAGWIELEKGEQAVHDAVVAFLAKSRAGTAATKNRAKIHGSGAKPYRQKGTGRARAGTRKSPIWRGGGIIFGPNPRSHAKKINTKVQRLALKRAFSERLAEGAVVVLEEIDVATPKTKAAKKLLMDVVGGEDALIIVDQPSDNLTLACRNLPRAEVMGTKAINPYWVLLFKKIAISKAAFDALMASFETKKATEQ